MRTRVRAQARPVVLAIGASRGGARVPLGLLLIRDRRGGSGASLDRATISPYARRSIQSGLRVSELVALRVGDVSLGSGAHLRVIGKGRKERCATLIPETVAVLREWMRDRHGEREQPLFPTRRGGAPTTRAVALLLDKHTATANTACPSLRGKRVTPHVLRHTNAKLLGAENIDILTIARWLGHYAGDPVKRRALRRARDVAFKQRGAGRQAFAFGRCR